MPTPEEIIRGIAQAAANAYDGSHDSKYSFDGESRKIGLRREEGDAILDSRNLDGFGVRFHGNQLCISYQTDVQLKETHENGFENGINSTVSDIAKYLRSEYKKITGNSLTLTNQGEPNIVISPISRVRTTVQATCYYNVGGLTGVVEVAEGSASSPEERLDDAIKKWLGYGKEKFPGAKKSSSVTRKGE